MDLNKLRDEVHANVISKGFWDEQLSDQHYLMLVITELSEAVEADREGRRAKSEEFKTTIHKLKQSGAVLTEQSYEHWYEHWFSVYFVEYIKDSVEDELADSFIRLLDLAGARNLNLNRFCLQYVVTKCKTVTENIYAIIKDLMNYKYSQEERINDALNQILRLSEILKIDLPFHIEQKMKYNQNRERLHGKKY